MKTKLIIILILLLTLLAFSSQAWATNIAKYPTGDSTVQFSTIAPTSPTTHWDKVDEITEDTTTYIQDTTSGHYDLYTFPSFSVPLGATISSVTIYSRARRVSGVISYKEYIRVNSTNYEGTAHAPTGTSWVSYSTTWATNPNTSAAWTVADVNGTGSNPLQAFGVINKASTSVRVTQVYIVVAFTPNPSRDTALNDNFEIATTGYEKTWTETAGSGTINETYALPADSNGNKPVYGGNQCVQVVVNNSTTETYIAIDKGSDLPITYSEIYVKFDSLSMAADTNNAFIFEGRGTLPAAGVSSRINVKRNGSNYNWQFQYISNNAIQTADYTSHNISTNLWYRLEMRYDTASDGNCSGGAGETCIAGVKIYQVGTETAIVDNEYTLTGVVRTGTRYWWPGVRNNPTKTITALFDRFQVDTGTYIGASTEFLGNLDGVTALRTQTKIIKAHNNDLFITINQGELGSATTYRSIDNGVTWTLSKRHHNASQITGAIIQHPTTHDIYVVYGYSAGNTGANADYDVKVDKATWSGSDWSWSSYGTIADAFSTDGYTCPEIAIDSTGQIWVALRYYSTSFGYAVQVYSDSGGTFTLRKQTSYYSDSETYPEIIAYGGATKKIGVMIQEQGSGYIKFFWHIDSESDDTPHTYTVNNADGRFADAEHTGGGSIFSHIDSDIDSSGNIWFVYQEDNGTGATTLAPSRVSGHYYNCIRKFTDSTSTWGSEEWIKDSPAADQYFYVSISITSGQRMFSFLNTPVSANNQIVMYERINGVWSEIGRQTGNYMKRAWQAKQDKATIGDSDYRIWQESWFTQYEVKFDTFTCGNRECEIGETPESCGYDCRFDNFDRSDSGSLGYNWVLDTNTDDGVCDEAGELCIDTLAVKAAADGTGIAHWAYPNAGVTQYGKVKISSISTQGKAGVIFRSEASSGYRYSLIYLKYAAPTIYLAWERYNWVTYTGIIDYETIALTDGDTISATIQGTGTGTVIKVWKNTTNNSPVDVNNWDSASDPCPATNRCWVLTDEATQLGTNPADNGTYTGILITKDTGIASPTLDDFYSGDVTQANIFSPMYYFRRRLN